MIGSKTLAPGAKCILMQADLAREMGRSAAQLLQQIHYWMMNDKVSGIIHDGKKWIINSYEEWADDLGIVSKSTIQRSLKKLKSLGLIEVNHLLKEQGNRTNCVSLKYDQIEALLSKNEKMNNPESPYLNAPHRVKMTLSSSQNESIIYSDKITNKDILITKSEEQSSKSVVSDQSKQVQQVDEIKKYTNGDEEKPNQSTTVQDMVTIWNKIFPNSQAKLTKELARNLNYAFQKKFESDMNIWKNYCLTIESSGYLTSDKFSLHLDWAIKFKTMDDIKNGRYGVKDIPIPSKLKHLEKDIIMEIQSLDEPEECRQKRVHLLQKYGIARYECHLKKAKLYAANGKVYFIGQTAFLHSEIEKAYRYELYAGIQEHFEECQNQPVEKFDSDASQSTSKPTDLDLELLIIDNSITESELIKQKRRTLCYELGVQTYRKHFRNLPLIEREGEIFLADRSEPCMTLANKITDILKSTLLTEKEYNEELYLMPCIKENSIINYQVYI